MVDQAIQLLAAGRSRRLAGGICRTKPIWNARRGLKDAERSQFVEYRVEGWGKRHAFSWRLGRDFVAAAGLWDYPLGLVRPPLTNCAARDIQDLRALMEVYADVIDSKTVPAAR